MDGEPLAELGGGSENWVGPRELGAFLDVGGREEQQDKEQQDAVWMGKEGKVLLVADGMGGHKDGKVASSKVVDAAEEVFGRIQETWLVRRRGKLDPFLTKKTMEWVVDEANKFIWAHNEEKKVKAGTTVAMAVLGPRELVVGWLGDSEVYLWTGSKLHQPRFWEEQGEEGHLTLLTQEHSLAEAFISAGVVSRDRLETLVRDKKAGKKLTKEEEGWVRGEHILTKHVGGDPNNSKLSYERVPVRVGDVVMLCSDGLHSAGVEPEIIEAVMAKVSSGEISAQKGANTLVAYAKGKGAPDNLSVIVRQVDEVSQVGFHPDQREALRDAILKPAVIDLRSEAAVSRLRKYEEVLRARGMWNNQKHAVPDKMLTLTRQDKWREWVMRIEKGLMEGWVIGEPTLVKDALLVQIAQAAMIMAKREVPRANDKKALMEERRRADRFMVWADTVRMGQYVVSELGQFERDRKVPVGVSGVVERAIWATVDPARQVNEGLVKELSRVLKVKIEEARELLKDQRRLVSWVTDKLQLTHEKEEADRGYGWSK